MRDEAGSDLASVPESGRHRLNPPLADRLDALEEKHLVGREPKQLPRLQREALARADQSRLAIHRPVGPRERGADLDDIRVDPEELSVDVDDVKHPDMPAGHVAISIPFDE